MSDQDPDQHWCLAPEIRIRIEIKAGSGSWSALTPIRVSRTLVIWIQENKTDFVCRRCSGHHGGVGGGDPAHCLHHRGHPAAGHGQGQSWQFPFSLRDGESGILKRRSRTVWDRIQIHIRIRHRTRVSRGNYPCSPGWWIRYILHRKRRSRTDWGRIQIRIRHKTRVRQILCVFSVSVLIFLLINEFWSKNSKFWLSTRGIEWIGSRSDPELGSIKLSVCFPPVYSCFYLLFMNFGRKTD